MHRSRFKTLRIRTFKARQKKKLTISSFSSKKIKKIRAKKIIISDILNEKKNQSFKFKSSIKKVNTKVKIINVEKSKSNNKNSQDKNIKEDNNYLKNINVKSIHCFLVRI